MRKNTLFTVLVIISLLFSDLLSVTQPALGNVAPPPPPTPVPTRPPVNPNPPVQPLHAPPQPNNLPPEVDQARAEEAIKATLDKYLKYWGPRYQVAPIKVTVQGDWAYGVADWQSQAKTVNGPIRILAHRLPQGEWQATLPSGDELCFQWLTAVPESLVPTGDKQLLCSQAYDIKTPVVIPSILSTPVRLVAPNQADSFNNRQELTQPLSLPAVTPVMSTSVMIPDQQGNTYAEDAINRSVAKHNAKLTSAYYYRVLSVKSAGEWAYADVVRIDRSSNRERPSEGSIILAHRSFTRIWTARLPEDGKLYNEWLDQIPNSLIDNLVKDMSRWTSSSEMRSAATVSGHYLPWASPNGAIVTQNYNTHGTGQIDFVPNVVDILATKDGTIVYVNDSHPDWAHGGTSGYATYNNVVVIRHTNTEYTIYLHLKQGSVPSWIKSQCPNGASGQTCSVTIQRGSKIGEMGNTGWSTGSHLHLSTASSFYVDTNNQDWLDEDGDGNKTELIYTAFTTSHITADFIEYPYYSQGCETSKTCLQYWPENDSNHKVYSQNSSSGSSCPGPSLQSPSDGYVSQDQTVSFSWSALSGCTFNGYTFRIKDTSDMDAGGSIVVDTGVGGTSRTETIGTQWNNRNLYWGVKAANAPNGASWSVRRFRIEPGSGCNPNADQIALFVDPGYGGQCVVKGIGDYTNPSAIGLPNDSISSVKVGGNVKAKLCRDDNYSGTCSDFTSDVSDLSGSSVGNDSVSSVKVESRSSGCSPNADQVALFVDSNYSGQCVIKGVGEYANPSAIGLPNDSISSVKVGGNVKAVLCRDDNYGGGCEDFVSDDNDLSNNSIGNDQVSSAKVQLRTQAPSAPNLQSPSNGSIFNEGDSINLTWSATGDQYYGEVWGGLSGTLPFGWQNEIVKNIGSQWAGYNYSWHVKARNGAGESGWSSTWSFIVKPAAPSNLNAQTASCSQINLYWSDNSGNEEGYKVYRNGSYIGQAGMNVTNYQDVGLNGNTSYSYFVRAYRGSIESNNSSTVNITTPTCAPPEPDLMPSQWGGWQYPVVPSSVTGTVVVNALYAGQLTYIDWGLTNFGGANTGGNTYADLYIDDIQIGHYNFGDVLVGQTWAFFDWGEWVNTPGWHTLKSIADPDNLITESDETNNVFEHQFYWVPTAPYFDDTESGSNDWSASGLWHQVDDNTSPYPASHSPSHSWWYGQDSTGNYDTGGANSGDLTSPSVYIPSTGYYLRFQYQYETETQGPDWDQRWIQISADGGPFNNVLQLYDDPRFYWLQSPAVDLSAYAGYTIQVRYHFDTLDETLNNYRGWYIDDFEISTTPPPSCTDIHEPNNSSQQATGIAYGQTISADICPGGDYDWYTFTGHTGDQVIADIDAAVNNSWLDAYTYLLDSDGTTVLTVSDDDGTTVDSKLGYTLPHDGTYYIKVRAWDHPSAGGPDYFYDLRLYLDNTSPSSAQIVSPSDSSWLDPNLVTIDAVASDDESGINHVEFLWHDADWQNSNWVWLGSDYYGEDGWNIGFDTSSLPEQQGGAFYIWAYDWTGNWTGAGAWNLGIDRTAPTITMNVIPAYGNAPFRDFYVLWEGSDAGSGVTTYDVQYRDGSSSTWSNLVTDTYNTYYNFVGQDSHTYYFRARARDLAGNRSAYTGGDGDVQYTVQTCPILPDSYETDNAYTNAKLITTDGVSQTHNIHIEGDQDWAEFYATAGVTYTIATTNDGGNADTELSLYSTDGATLIDFNDDYSGMYPSSRIDWQPMTSGVYYIEVDHWDPWAYGCTTAYGLSIVTNDNAAPSGSILINSGNTYVTSTNTIVNLSAFDAGTGVDKVKVANDSAFTGANWVSYTNSLAWTLPAGDGTKAVHVQFRDRAGNVSSVYSDTIILDTIAPTGNIIIQNGDSVVTSTAVILALSASDINGVTSMRIHNDSAAWGTWEPFSSSRSWSIPLQAGQHFVWVQYRDSAGNVSTPFSDSIVFQWPYNVYLPSIRR